MICVVVRKFEPALLDKQAAGSVDGASADPSLIEQARKLPINRYDLWYSKDAVPSFMEQVCC